MITGSIHTASLNPSMRDSDQLHWSHVFKDFLFFVELTIQHSTKIMYRDRDSFILSTNGTLERSKVTVQTKVALPQSSHTLYQIQQHIWKLNMAASVMFRLCSHCHLIKRNWVTYMGRKSQMWSDSPAASISPSLSLPCIIVTFTVKKTVKASLCVKILRDWK